MIGSLKSIEERLDLVTEISGSSAGAILALFLGLNMSVDEILNRSLLVDTTKLIGTVSIRNIIKNYGGIDPEISKQMMREACGCDPTFRDMKKKIYVSSYNIVSCETEYFSVDTHPDMKVIDAVYMSCTIPFVFACQNMHVDGGFQEKVPIKPFVKHPNKEILVIETYSDNINPTLDNFITFATCIVKSIMKQRIDYTEFTNRIKINICMSQVTDFKMSRDDKMSLYFKGLKEKIISL